MTTTAALACVQLPLTAMLYGLLALRGWRYGRRYRAAARRCALMDVDPYHAASGQGWYGDDLQAAAAHLVLDGLATVNHRGNLRATAAGADTGRAAGHPLPDALLAALRRRTAPAALGNLEQRDSELWSARQRFHAPARAAAEALRPAPPRPPGCLAAMAALLLIGWMAFTAAAVVDRVPRGPVEWLAAVAAGLAVVAQLALLDRYGKVPGPAGGRPDPVEARMAALRPHPALAELAARDPEAERCLRVSRLRVRRSRNRGRPRRRTAPPGRPDPSAGGDQGGGSG
ncbi:hypothetical protein ACIQV2_18150 [Streptomyces globosus]|uniref:hypothetical protein n=1 Tax=Streptomyces globosus TaxID=68209 RepID=UPI0038223779